MTDTQPDPLPSDTLGQVAPLDPAWPAHLIEPYRNNILDRMDETARRGDDALEVCKTLDEKADRELDQLRARIPDLGEERSLVEWLTRRAAQVEYDLAESRLDMASQEALIKRNQLSHETRTLEARVGHLDYLTESGPYAAGNDSQLSIIELDLQESAVRLVHEKVTLEYARQRMGLVKQLHREVNTALRAAKRAEERAAKSGR